MPDLQFLRDGLVVVLGEPDSAQPTIRVAGTESPFPCVFREPSQAGVLGGVAVQRTMPELLARGEDWDDLGAHVGAFITLRGKEYEIVRFQRNAADVVTAALRESR